MLLYNSFLSDSYRGQCNKTCFSSSITELVCFLQNKHNLSSRGILLNLAVSTANLWLLILILVYQIRCVLFKIVSRYHSMQNLLLKDTYVFSLLKLEKVLDQYILNFSQRKDCNITVADGSPVLPFIDLHISSWNENQVETPLSWRSLQTEDASRSRELEDSWRWYQYLKACIMHEKLTGKRPSSPLTARLTALLFTPSINLQNLTCTFSIFIDHYYLYFMVQWICLVSWRMLDVWTLYFVIMGQCNAV